MEKTSGGRNYHSLSTYVVLKHLLKACLLVAGIVNSVEEIALCAQGTRLFVLLLKTETGCLILDTLVHRAHAGGANPVGGPSAGNLLVFVRRTVARGTCGASVINEIFARLTRIARQDRPGFIASPAVACANPNPNRVTSKQPLK